MSPLNGRCRPSCASAPLAALCRLALAIALLATTGEVWASRRYRPLGDYVREAAVIVLADTKTAWGGGNGGHTTLMVTEVLKGEPKLLGQEIVFGMGRLSSASAHVPAPAKGVVVMLPADWQEKTADWPVVEACSTPEQVAAVRALLAIYREATERQRLVALQARALAGDAICLDQLLADLRAMREPENLDLMTGLYPRLLPKMQVRLVEAMADTGDLRVVPVLLRALQSPDGEVSRRAVDALRFHYPGAPGVTAAFTALLTAKPPLDWIAVTYLVPYRADMAARIEEQATPWSRANRLWATDRAAARAAFLALVADPQGSFYTRAQSALKLLPEATPTERDQIRQALLPMLNANAQGDSYIEAETAAQILRELHHPDCLPALLTLATRRDSCYEKAARTAVFAIRELGPDACGQGFARLLAGLQPVPRHLNGDEIGGYLLAMVWLGNRESYSQVDEHLPEAHRAAWQRLAPLWPLAEQPDEVVFLSQQLGAPGDLPRVAREWLVTRLGELKDPRAVPVLMSLLVQEGDYGIGVALGTALVQIGGPQAEDALTALLANPARQEVRARAVEALFVILGERAVPLARRMLREKDFGAPHAALRHLGHFGTVEDLALLAPWCDYWHADRALHHWAMLAMAELRERCGYDLNGPIPKEPADH